MSVWVDNEEFPVAIFIAFNAVVTAWHITDWLWQSSSERRVALAKRYNFAYAETETGIRKGLERFQNAVVEDCRALYVCREIANGSKHMRRKKAARPICCVTTGRMPRPIRCGRRGCASTSRRSWWSGGGTIPRSSLSVRGRISAICRMLISTSSTLAISLWTRRTRRSRDSFSRSWPDIRSDRSVDCSTRLFTLHPQNPYRSRL
jgi:hypothetical protein